MVDQSNVSSVNKFVHVEAPVESHGVSSLSGWPRGGR